MPWAETHSRGQRRSRLGQRSRREENDSQVRVSPTLFDCMRSPTWPLPSMKPAHLQPIPDPSSHFQTCKTKPRFVHCVWPLHLQLTNKSRVNLAQRDDRLGSQHNCIHDRHSRRILFAPLDGKFNQSPAVTLGHLLLERDVVESEEVRLSHTKMHPVNTHVFVVLQRSNRHIFKSLGSNHLSN
jgi:hypothetical protein